MTNDNLGETILNHHMIQEEEKIKQVAKEAAKEIVDLATATASAVHASTAADINYIKKDIAIILDRLDHKYVSTETFAPVRMLVYGMCGLMLSAVVGGLMFMLIHR